MHAPVISVNALLSGFCRLGAGVANIGAADITRGDEGLTHPENRLAWRGEEKGSGQQLCRDPISNLALHWARHTAQHIPADDDIELAQLMRAFHEIMAAEVELVAKPVLDLPVAAFEPVEIRH